MNDHKVIDLVTLEGGSNKSNIRIALELPAITQPGYSPCWAHTKILGRFSTLSS